MCVDNLSISGTTEGSIGNIGLIWISTIGFSENKSLIDAITFNPKKYCIAFTNKRMKSITTITIITIFDIELNPDLDVDEIEGSTCCEDDEEDEEDDEFPKETKISM